MDLEEIIKELKGIVADYDRERVLLLGRIEDLKNVQAGLLERGIALEQLCRDMWEYIMEERWNEVHPNAIGLDFSGRMDALGLLEGGEK